MSSPTATPSREYVMVQRVGQQESESHPRLFTKIVPTETLTPRDRELLRVINGSSLNWGHDHDRETRVAAALAEMWRRVSAQIPDRCFAYDSWALDSNSDGIPVRVPEDGVVTEFYQYLWFLSRDASSCRQPVMSM